MSMCCDSCTAQLAEVTREPTKIKITTRITVLAFIAKQLQQIVENPRLFGAEENGREMPRLDW